MSAREELFTKLRNAGRILRDADQMRVAGDDTPDEKWLALYRQQVAAALQERFSCSISSLWRLAGAEGSRRLVCVAAFSSEPGQLPQGAEIHEHEFRDYLNTLAINGIYKCPDTMADPNLAGMRDSYLVPLQVRALLDAAFRVNGRTYGVLCIEQRHTPRSWTIFDEVDLRKAASIISLQLASSPFRPLELGVE